MTTSVGSTRPSVTGAIGALDGYLARLGAGRARPPLRYLRRKPGRGLVAVFGLDEGGDVYTVSVADGGNAGAPDVHRFPEDPRLPHLAAVMAPAAHPSLAAALESTARRAHDFPAGLPLLGMAAEPVRYKPGDRCVLRYRLTFGDPGGRTTTRTLVAKLYREPAEAREADDLLARLRTGPAAAWTARPLGVVEGVPLALTEDLGSTRDAVPARSGLREVRIGSAGAFPVVAGAARALAELHTSGLGGGLRRRTGADEAGKAAKRARVLEQHVPGLAAEVRRVTGTLGDALTALPEDTLRPAHGSYKPSQLLVREGAVFLVDFDQFCLADPALDVGYFLAYLRPAGLWYHRAGRRAWFEAAAEVFLSTYRGRLTERGESPAAAAAIAGRASVYEAALLLKIAARRANRLHSPRPGEVAAVLDEVTRCLGSVPRPRHPVDG
jgi:Phosphotransferase enzyme family